MQAALRLAATLLLCCSLASPQAKAGAASQSTKLRKPAASPLRSECLDSVGLCISVPAGWQRLGEIFEGLGFVAAEPHSEGDPASWPQLTVAAIDVSPKRSDGNAASPSLDALVDRMLTPGGPLASAHLLERSTLLLNGANAQIVRVGLPDETGGAGAIETVALIEGEEGMVYSIALRCSPTDVNRLEPVFRQALQSWRIQSAEAAPSSAPTNPPRVGTQPKASQSNVNPAKADPAGPAQTKP